MDDSDDEDDIKATKAPAPKAKEPTKPYALQSTCSNPLAHSLTIPVKETRGTARGSNDHFGLPRLQ